MTLLARWRQRAKQLKRETYTLYLACRDPRMPWYVRVLAAGVVAYAFSPIDLIPDWIPIIGYLDDLILVPLGIALVVKLTPPEVMAECRARAEVLLESKPVSWVAAGFIIVIWLLLAGGLAVYLWRVW